jgi:hypothetical protein
VTENWGGWLLVAIPAAIVVGLIAFLVFVVAPADAREREAWARWCAGQGGHVDEHTDTSTGTGINPQNGQPIVITNTSTTYYCLSEDGRILGIR